MKVRVSRAVYFKWEKKVVNGELHIQKNLPSELKGRKHPQKKENLRHCGTDIHSNRKVVI